MGGSVYASPAGAAGKIYFVGRDGSTLVIKHGPNLQILAKNKLDDVFDATPAIIGREIIMRGSKFLYCLREK